MAAVVAVPAFSITSDWSSPLITHQWLDLICPVDASDRDLSRSSDSCYWLWEICQLKERDAGGRDPLCPWRRMETCLITSCSDSLLGLVDLQPNKSRGFFSNFTLKLLFHVFFFLPMNFFLKYFISDSRNKNFFFPPQRSEMGKKKWATLHFTRTRHTIVYFKEVQNDKMLQCSEGFVWRSEIWYMLLCVRLKTQLVSPGSHL